MSSYDPHTEMDSSEKWAFTSLLCTLYFIMGLFVDPGQFEYGYFTWIISCFLGPPLILFFVLDGSLFGLFRQDPALQTSQVETNSVQKFDLLKKLSGLPERELRTLCHRLGLEWDTLPGATSNAKVLGLYGTLLLRGRLTTLYEEFTSIEEALIEKKENSPQTISPVDRSVAECTLSCPCGEKIGLKLFMAGSNCICPSCSSTISIPGALYRDREHVMPPSSE